MPNNIRNSTLIDNIAGNLVRAGQHRPLVSGQASVLQNQQTSLRNNLMMSQAAREKAAIEQQAAMDVQMGTLGAKVNAVLNDPNLTPPQRYAKLNKADPQGLTKAAEHFKAEVDMRYKATEEKRTSTEFDERNNPKAGRTTPYFTPVQTAGGVFAFDNRKGTLGKPIYEGDAIVGSKSDPALQANIAQSKEIGQKKGAEDQALYEMVSSAPPKIQKLDEVLGLLESSDSITGLGAEALKNLERAKVMFGANADSLDRTQLLDVMLGADVFPMIQDLKLGSKGMDTPAERDYMRQVLTGQITLEKSTLIKMTKLRKRLIQTAIDKWDSRVDNGELDRWSNATGIKAKKYGDMGRSTTTEPKASKGVVIQPQPLTPERINGVEDMTDEQILNLY